MQESRSRASRRWWLLLALAVAAVALVAAGCGGGDDEGEEPAAGGETGQTQTGGQAGTGNAIKVAVLSDCQGAFG
ncbi:MAG: hypothetical protein M3322_00845, partial [Actinomycetota bacterium]|nr:hypothetical protein [Actinomycetota bacterium]